MEEERDQIIDIEMVKEEKFVILMVQIIVKLTINDCEDEKGDTLPSI